jgi:hypothetical protein
MRRIPSSKGHRTQFALAALVGATVLGHATPAAAASCDLIKSPSFIAIQATSSDGLESHTGTIDVSEARFELFGGRWLYRSEWTLRELNLHGEAWLPIYFFASTFSFAIDLSDDLGEDHRSMIVEGVCNGAGPVTGMYSLTNPVETGTITLTPIPHP